MFFNEPFLIAGEPIESLKCSESDDLSTHIRQRPQLPTVEIIPPSPSCEDIPIQSEDFGCIQMQTTVNNNDDSVNDELVAL